MTERVYTVTELQRAVRLHLEEAWPSVWVEGEVSGHTHPSSGHRYFTLKDEGAQLRAVMWRSSAQRLKFALEDGLLVRARGRLTVYEPRGSYQMVVEALEPKGVGPLQIAFEQMRRKLEAEGLFDPSRKVPLPAYPRRVALVTSPTGAAVRDLIEVALRRWPPLQLVVLPVRVQGEGAAAEIAGAIGLADGLGFDLIVVGRGGGSPEDLWAFNEEAVARAIFRAKTPVVSAVGHEVDVSISDLVADLRAPTPSAAAELFAPDATEARAALGDDGRRLSRAMRGTLEALRARLETVRASSAFKRPLDRIRSAEQRLDEGAGRLVRALRALLARQKAALDGRAGRLEALSPLKVLARGFSVTMREGRVVTRAAQVKAGDALRTLLHQGEIVSRAE
ncbi:MAG: exodeoxyribonuclease VII large subunit [Planctomycetaceae bacterium]